MNRDTVYIYHSKVKESTKNSKHNILTYKWAKYFMQSYDIKMGIMLFSVLNDATKENHFKVV